MDEIDGSYPCVMAKIKSAFITDTDNRNVGVNVGVKYLRRRFRVSAESDGAKKNGLAKPSRFFAAVSRGLLAEVRPKLLQNKYHGVRVHHIYFEQRTVDGGGNLDRCSLRSQTH